MNKRLVVLAGVAVTLCVATGGTVGVLRAFADNGGTAPPPIVRAVTPSAPKVAQTAGVKLQATWVHTGGGSSLSPGFYNPVDAQITVICKKEPCLLVVDKMADISASSNTGAVAPCVIHDGAAGGGDCSWLGSTGGVPAGQGYAGTTIESLSLTEGAHTVNVGVYTGVSGITVQSYTFVYRLYR